LIVVPLRVAVLTALGGIDPLMMAGLGLWSGTDPEGDPYPDKPAAGAVGWIPVP
jgi:hypothetical protein